jgi:hypothetical protein
MDLVSTQTATSMDQVMTFAVNNVTDIETTCVVVERNGGYKALVGTPLYLTIEGGPDVLNPNTPIGQTAATVAPTTAAGKADSSALRATAVLALTAIVALFCE